MWSSPTCTGKLPSGTRRPLCDLCVWNFIGDPILVAFTPPPKRPPHPGCVSGLGTSSLSCRDVLAEPGVKAVSHCESQPRREDSHRAWNKRAEGTEPRHSHQPTLTWTPGGAIGVHPRPVWHVEAVMLGDQLGERNGTTPCSHGQSRSGERQPWVMGITSDTWPDGWPECHSRRTLHCGKLPEPRALFL